LQNTYYQGEKVIMMRQNRLFYKLLQHYTSHNTANKGFVLPLVIGMGLIMTVAGLTMVIRSSDQQIAAEQKVQNEQAKRVFLKKI